MMPVRASTASPAGRSGALNVMGRLPVAGMVKRKGWPGRTPNTRAPLMRGVAGGGGVRMWAEWSGVAAGGSFSCAAATPAARTKARPALCILSPPEIPDAIMRGMQTSRREFLAVGGALVAQWQPSPRYPDPRVRILDPAF